MSLILFLQWVLTPAVRLHAETNHKLSSGGGLRVVSVVMKDKPGGVDINRVSYSYEDPVVRAVRLRPVS